MKPINKQPEPDSLRHWKAHANADWQPRYADMPGDIKRALRHALIAEQGGVCAYCESRLLEADSHIDHVRPQHDPQCDPLDYSNMVCSCQNNLPPKEPRHCGMRKDAWFDEALLVSPLDASCAGRFVFTGDGRILPNADDPAAAETIDRLGLDITKLRSLRKAVFDGFLEPALSDEELRTLLADYVARDAQGHYGAYVTAVAYVFGDYLT